MQAPLWRKIQKENFTKLEPLLEFLQFSSDQQNKLLSSPRFNLNLPRRLAEKIAKNDLNDPLFRQFVPLHEETLSTPGFTLEPVLDQEFRKSKKILHKYKQRALLITTSACAMHCRYCFRQNFPYETTTAGFEDEISYIKNDPTLSEVILSGGDPLSLSDKSLESLLSQLDAITHIKRIRFHTRFLIGIPERIDSSFLKILQQVHKQIIFVIHVNHPNEIDADVTVALKNLQKLGIPILNQSVLLQGVNDLGETLLALSEKLISIGVTPYYLHLLDKVEGAAHFNVSEEKGKELIEYIRENLSGFGVPRLVREEPGKPSKTFIC